MENLNNSIESKLMEAARLADTNQTVNLDTLANDFAGLDANPKTGQESQNAATDKTAGNETPATDSSKTVVSKEPASEPKKDETTNQTKTDQSIQEKPAEKTEDSKYQKARKDSERLDKSWKSLNDEKEKFRAEREKELAEIKRLREESVKKEADDPLLKYEPDELEEAAKEWDEEGDTELAERARKEAVRLRKVKGELEAQKQNAAFEETRNRAWNESMEKYPSLKDINSEFSQGVISLIKQEKVFSLYPEGWRDAARVVELRQKAAKAESFEKRVKELEDENKKLREATAISGSPPSDRAKAKSFSEMSPAEMDAYLTRQAKEHDYERSYA